MFSVCEDYVENRSGYFVYDSVTSNTQVNQQGAGTTVAEQGLLLPPGRTLA